MYHAPGLLWALTLVGVVGVPVTTILVLYRGAKDARLAGRSAALLAGGAALVLGGWFAASAVFAAHGGYRTQLGQQPPWLAIAAVTVLVALLALSRIPAVARALSAPDMAGRLMLPHTFRLAGLAFLITMALGHLPALFAIPAGLGDMAVGVAAVRVARGTGPRDGLWFHALGITDLVVAMVLGGLTGYHIVHVTPVHSALTALPLVLIPTAEVPLLLALHIVSIRALRTASATPQSAATQPVTVGV